jgi:uncharacterized membrane protein
VLRSRDNMKSQFAVSDIAQQFIGSFLICGPFVVTEETWIIAQNLRPWQMVIAILISSLIAYLSLYKADASRDSEDEEEIGGVPLRFISLIGISFGSVVGLAILFGAPSALANITMTPIHDYVILILKLTSIVSIFSVVGAATADTVF